MSRNGSGTMSVVNTMIPGTPITASDHNENYVDIAAEITNSVAVDGQSTMTGALKVSSGTAALPGVAFGADTDSGMYRIGANNVGFAVNGTKIVDVATTGMTVTGTVDATAVTQGGASLLPAGVILPYGGSAAPTGYLICDGSSLLRADYPALFTAIGTTYGAADGTHFTLPDMGGRVPAGKESVATRLTTAGGGVDGATLGSAAGAQSQTLTAAQIPTINSNVTVSGTASSFQVDGSSANFQTLSPVGGAFSNLFSGSTGYTVRNGSQMSASVAATGTAASSNTGGGAHPNVQPTIIVNYIIKT